MYVYMYVNIVLSFVPCYYLPWGGIYHYISYWFLWDPTISYLLRFAKLVITLFRAGSQ